MQDHTHPGNAPPTDIIVSTLDGSADPGRRAAVLSTLANGLLEDMLVPGLAGQGRIHARLEDLGAVLRWLREHASELPATERASIAEAIGHCQRCLRQADALFGALQGWLQQRDLPAQASADYREAVSTRSQQRPRGRAFRSSVEASG